MYEVIEYLDETGKDHYKLWLESIADRQARARVLTRINRMATGNLGDCKHVSDGVWELRINWGPGYRVYYAHAGKRLILLLAGGDKRRQQADINTAVSYWHDWQSREKHHE
ncbi:MAG: type II toxin-antitoxin system RelE/ParE family toxin [Castellaniella sp.]|uniref:type II toxin-antitoxin system RelE/ParE family toxin n=1 Tax=Castellaniella sp. TaxID=1955812 RepID=UPI001226C019|nr:type II toxin-antitoxin system RelE/ParE family toxin [Castellaniella sp.]TAN27922.1 MAG: type II toxin-antitoxin system RelE/ParE family toxin [Castellaniella sp.]